MYYLIALMDILFIIAIAATLFGLALLTSSLWSLVSCWRTARGFGLHISLMEARPLTKFFELDEEFVIACRDFKSTDPSIKIKDIVHHHFADGDTLQLLSNWKIIQKSKVDMTFQALVLFDLAGKDIDSLLLEEAHIFTIQFREVLEPGLHVNYFCQFKIAINSVGWIKPDLDHFTQDIKMKMELAIMAGDMSDYSALAAFIDQQYLDSQYWKSLCHGEVVAQQIQITKP